MRTIVVAAAGVILLASCAGPAAQTPAATASQTASSPSGTAPTSPEATPTRTSEASVTPGASLSPNLVPGPARVAVEQLRVRTEPGLGAPQVTFPYADNNAAFDVQLELFEGMPVWLLDEEPVTRDGHEWRKIAVNNTLYNDGSILVGWVAQAASDGSPWLVPFSHEVPLSSDCPVISNATIEHIDLDSLRWMSVLGPACFGGETVTFAAYWPELHEGAGLGGVCGGPEPAWLLCSNTHYAHVNVTGDTAWGLAVHAPDVYEQLGERGQWLMLTGHFDDPAAPDCEHSQQFDTSPEAAEMFCRTRFVLESAQPAQKPGS